VALDDPTERTTADARAVGAAPAANASSRALVRNAAVSYGAFAVQTLTAFIATPLILNGIGESAFGILVVVQAIATYILICEFGVGTASVRSIAAAQARGDSAELNRVTAASVVLFTGLVGIGTVALAIIVANLGVLIDVTGPALHDAQIAVVFVAGAQLVGLLFNIYRALLFGSGRADILLRTGVVVATLGAVAQVLVAVSSGSLIGVAAATGATTVVTAIVVRRAARRTLGTPRISRHYLSGRVVRRLLSSGWQNGVIAASAAIAVSSDVIIVGAVLSVTAAAAYGVAVRAATFLRALGSRGTDVLVPAYAHHAAVSDQPTLYGLLRDATTISWLIILPLSLPPLLFADDLLQLWLHTVPASSADVLRILVVIVILNVPGNNVFTLLTGIDRLRFLLVSAAVLAIVNLATSIVFAKHFGIIGPALGTLVTFSVLEFVILPVYACRILGVPSLRLARDCMWLCAPFFSAGVLGLGLAQLKSGALASIPWSVVVVSVFAGVAWAMTRTESRSRYRQAGIRTLRRANA
jgi:O-antigen/teichoic acid export membrane protein